MARQENLTVIKGGLTRHRTKGAALKDSLFQLLNGFVTTEKTVSVRPGTIRRETLPAGTVGLVSFGGKLQVFASSDVANIPVGYNLNLLRAPDGEALVRVHFAEPFLGALYIAAEFADGDVFHFWLPESDTWLADNIYDFNATVKPTILNSFNYRATRNGPANPIWTEGAPRTVGDRVEPTVANGFFFEVDQIFGPSARSGTIEPDWNNVTEGQLINENVDGTVIPPDATPPTPVRSDTIDEDRRDRYDRDGSGSERG